MKLLSLLFVAFFSVTASAAQIGYDYGDGWLDFFNDGDEVIAHAIIDYGNGLCYEDDPYAAFNNYFKLGQTYGTDYGVLGMMTLTAAEVATTSEGPVLLIQGNSSKEGDTSLELPLCPKY